MSEETNAMRAYEEYLVEIKKLSKKITDTQRKFDTKEFTGYEAAGNLQKMKRDRKVLMSHLPALRLASVHPDPDSLPPVPKRTRAEIRAFAGLPPLSEEADD